MAKKELLTKEQRHSAYLLMLADFDNYWYGKDEGGYCKGMGMCFHIWELFGIENDGFSNGEDYDRIGRVIENHFPELENRRPESQWPYTNKNGIEQRREWLRQCAEETYSTSSSKRKSR